MSLDQFQKSHHLIDHQNKVVYCYIAKNACSTIKFNFLRKKLRALGDKTPEDQLNARLHILAKEHCILNESPASFGDYYAFSVIRQPHSRVGSAFLDKFVQSKALPNYARSLIQNHGGGKDPDEFTFSDFIYALAESRIESLNEHWMPQYAHPIEDIIYDFVPMEAFSMHQPLLRHYSDLSVNVREHSLQYTEKEEPSHLIPVRSLRAAFESTGRVPGWRTLFHPSIEAPFLSVFQRDLDLHNMAKTLNKDGARHKWQTPRITRSAAMQQVSAVKPAPNDLPTAQGALISVIVPVYNVEPYIRDCMESLARQDDSSFEVVVVDDGSPDQSIEVVRAFNDRIKNLVIHSQENRGLGGARNTGVKIARGNFVVFVDSDDTVTPNFISSLRKAQIDGNYCVVSGRFQLVSEDLDFLRLTHEPEPPKLSPAIKPHESVLGALSRSVSCARLYRKQTLMSSGLEFPEGVPHEDLFFTYKILRRAKSVGECPEYLYSWRQRQGSLGRSLTQAHIDILPRLRRDTYDFLDSVGADRREYAFAARRNLSLVSWFRAKARRADPEVRAAFFEMVNRNLDDINADLSRFEALNFPNDTIAAKAASLIKEATRMRRSNGDVSGDADHSPSHQMLVSRARPETEVDFAFFPLRAYHLRECASVAPELQGRGYRTQIIETDDFRKGNDEVRKAASELGLSLVPLTEFTSGEYAVRAVVFLNDWDPLMRVISKSCHELGVSTVGWVEGVNDYHDVDTGRQRFAYLRSQHVITPGEFDTKYFDDPRQQVHSGEVVRIRALWKNRTVMRAASGRLRALINSNFSYGVLEDKRDEWVRAAVRACIAAGFDPVISRHPFDLGTEHREFRTDKSFFDAIKECDVSIQRFGSGILESLAMGVPVIYFNSHGEKIDKFAESKDAFLSAPAEEILRDQLNDRKYFWREAEAFAFLQLHTGLVDDSGAEEPRSRIADILESILESAGGPNHGLARRLAGAGFINHRRKLSDEAKSIEPFYGSGAQTPHFSGSPISDAGTAGNALISVIVPVYNVEKYVGDCLSSLAAQTDDNFEIIIVDDESTDRSIEIVKSRASEFARLLIHSQRNQGLGGARNAGLDLAGGEFVVFVDSDDIVTPGFIRSLRSRQVEGNFDIVSGRLDRISETGERLPRSSEPSYMKVTPPISDYERTLGVLSPSVSCARLIRRSLIVESGLRFPSRTPHEDLFFTYKLMRSARHGLLEKHIYRWRQRPDSLSKSLTKDHIDAWRMMRQDTQAFLDSVNATGREYAFASRRNLIILENFSRKVETAPAEIKSYFETILSKHKDEILSDLARVSGSEIAHIYFPKRFYARLGHSPEQSSADRGDRHALTFPTRFAAHMRARAPRLFAAFNLAKRAIASVWRRRRWTAPLTVLLLGAFVVSFLPVFASYRGLIWSGLAFAAAMLSFFYLWFRLQQYVSILSSQVTAVSRDASALRVRLAAETAERKKSQQASAEATAFLKQELTAANERLAAQMNATHSLLRAGVSNALITARSNADALSAQAKARHEELSGALTHLEDGFYELRNEMKKGREEDLRTIRDAIENDRKEVLRKIQDRIEKDHNRLMVAIKQKASEISGLRIEVTALRSSSVALDLVSAMRSLQPLLRSREDSVIATAHSNVEHGHSLMMDLLAEEARRNPGRLTGRTLIEIGATRELHFNQKSTEKLAIFTALTNMNLISVDMDPDNIERIDQILPFLNPSARAVAGKGEDFLAAYEASLDYVYLDAFDFDHDKHSNKRRERYQEILHTDINDEECWKMHALCAGSIIEKMAIGGIVVIDDTWTDEDGVYAGKGKIAVPMLLESGFDVVASTPSTIALKRKSI